jgi:hypothetical protein
MKSHSLSVVLALFATGSISVACSDSFEDAAPTSPDAGSETGVGGSGGGAAGTGGEAGTAGVGGTGGTQAGGAGGEDAGPDGSAGVAGSAVEDAGPGGAAGNAGSGGAAGASGADAGTCPSGYGDCDGDDSNGCETLLDTTDNCGSCAHECGAEHATASCESFTCSFACADNYEDCDGDDANGCETPLGTMENCGSCGDGCVTPAHATAACESATCNFVCTGSYEDCDGNAANGCEVDIASTPAHCGTCSNACPSGGHGTATCSNSTCGIDCATDWDNCDGQLANGCEVSLGTDVNHCGACGNSCPVRPHASTACQNGSCTFMCDAGWEDCDGNASNGCEVDLNTDVANCGACDQGCGSAHGTPHCTGGTCSITCSSGYGDCDGANANGCEINLTNTTENCGTCGRDCLQGTCSASQCEPWLLASTSDDAHGIAVNDNHVYWTQHSGVSRISVNGGTPQFLANCSDAWSIALDGSHVYWTSLQLSGGIYRTVLAGGTVELIVGGQENPTGIAVTDSAVFWGHGDGLRKKGFAVPKPTNVTGGPYVSAVAVDGMDIYFTSGANPGAVSKVLQSGGSVTTLMGNQNLPSQLALDNNDVYFTVLGSGNVQKVGKDGYGSQLLASGYDAPTGIDISGKYVFFADSSGHLVVQVPKTGGAAITRMNYGYPYALKASNGIIYWTDLTDHCIYAMVE